MAGLDTAAVHRLKATKAALPAEVLVQIVDKASSEPEPDAAGEPERSDDDPHHVSRCACAW